MISSLDQELSRILKPLVAIGTVVRVSQFPNTLCLGFHYLLAHGDNGVYPNKITIPSGRIDLGDWNHPNETLQRDKNHLTGIYLMYQTKSKADGLRNQQLPSQSFFDSIPTTRFRPRFAFLLATPEAREIAHQHDGVLSQKLFETFTARKYQINVRTDVIEQAKALVSKLGGSAGSLNVRYVGPGWPSGAATEDDVITLLYYGAPSTAYMKGHPDVFIPLHVEDGLVSQVPAFETHAVWTVPKNRSDQNGVVRGCMEQYHQLLFGSASESGTADHFSAMRTACNEILGQWHPSFPHRVLASPDAFQTLLNDHHCSPD